PTGEDVGLICECHLASSPSEAARQGNGRGRAFALDNLRSSVVASAYLRLESFGPSGETMPSVRLPDNLLAPSPVAEITGGVCLSGRRRARTHLVAGDARPRGAGQ